jgi:hypothetical protein
LVWDAIADGGSGLHRVLNLDSEPNFFDLRGFVFSLRFVLFFTSITNFFCRAWTRGLD